MTILRAFNSNGKTLVPVEVKPVSGTRMTASLEDWKYRVRQWHKSADKEIEG